jgi:hypothetical protein
MATNYPSSHGSGGRASAAGLIADKPLRGAHRDVTALGLALCANRLYRVWITLSGNCRPPFARDHELAIGDARVELCLGMIPRKTAVIPAGSAELLLLPPGSRAPRRMRDAGVVVQVG